MHLRRFAVGLLAALVASAALAAPASYVNVPMDTPQALVNTAITNVNTNLAPQGAGTVSGSIYIPAVTSGVNEVLISGSATGSPVVLSAYGSDTNVGIQVYGQGSGVVSIGASSAAASSVQISPVTSSVNFVSMGGAIASTGTPYILGTGTDTNVGLLVSTKGTGAVSLGGTTAANRGFGVVSVASAVNHFIATPAVTSAIPTILTGGSGADANIGGLIGTNGTGTISIGGSTAANTGLGVVGASSAVNHVIITPGATGTAATIGAGGSGADTNRNLALTAQGTGVVTLGATTTCSGTTTATCTGQRFTVSITGLTTAAQAKAADMVVTNTSVLSSASQIICGIGTYAGNGGATVVQAAAGTSTATITLVNAGNAALNATVPVNCLVIN